jgi:hypothetical protein
VGSMERMERAGIPSVLRDVWKGVVEDVREQKDGWENYSETRNIERWAEMIKFVEMEPSPIYLCSSPSCRIYLRSCA